ncbi:SAVED domain-containing protein [Leptolyngbya sp. 7M]|uniref:SAVED domain-containing protein n=1 Tax=Leptolyngbya sp. 7M TaxID=2812896 RepID=UPI001CEDAA44|nr:SAVED domain-containing protein [Leptolyngbya sp. 7M]
MVYAEPEIGTGDAVIRSDADATALAIHGKELIRHYRQTYRAASTHLILYAPLGFCLFLGQRLNAVGEIIAYERTLDGSYQAALKLQTG